MRKLGFVLATIILMAAMAVPAAAQVPGPGGPYNSAFTIQNLEATAASCVFSLYDSAGNADYTSAAVTVPASGSYFVYVGGLSIASDRYSAVISCDRQVAAVSNFTDATSAASFSGVSSTETATTLYAPGVYKNYYGYMSNVVVQNTTASPINITLEIYLPGSSTPLTSSTATNVPAYASTVFDQSALTTNGIFSAKVTATGAAAAVVNIWNTAGQQFSYNAFAAGTTTAYAPVLMNNYYGFNTALTIQNLSNSATNVTVTYSNGKVSTASVAANSSRLFYTPNEGLPNGFIGSAKVTSSGGQVVALINESSTANRAASYSGFTAGGTTVSAPIVLKAYYGYSTSITCQNIGMASTNITVNYSNGATETLAAAANGTALFYQPNLATLPNGFNGSATISASGGQSIVCIVNENQVTNPAAQDWLLSYNSIVQ